MTQKKIQLRVIAMAVGRTEEPIVAVGGGILSETVLNAPVSGAMLSVKRHSSPMEKLAGSLVCISPPTLRRADPLQPLSHGANAIWVTPLAQPSCSPTHAMVAIGASKKVSWLP